MRIGSLLTLFGPLGACATVQHVQIGEIDATAGVARPFPSAVTTKGFNSQVVADEVSSLAGVPVVSDIVSMFSHGPRTGRPTYSPAFVGELQERLAEKCADGGRVTGLQVTRSTQRIPFAGSDAVEIKGFCVYPEVM